LTGLHQRIRQGATRARWRAPARASAGFLTPTGQAEPVGSDTGLPVRFRSETVEIGEIQISNQNLSSIGSHRYTDRYDQYTDPVQRGTGRLTKKIGIS
jgi:hypothetical protein